MSIPVTPASDRPASAAATVTLATTGGGPASGGPNGGGEAAGAASLVAAGTLLTPSVTVYPAARAPRLSRLRRAPRAWRGRSSIAP